jgi:hypothetical protein
MIRLFISNTYIPWISCNTPSVCNLASNPCNARDPVASPSASSAQLKPSVKMIDVPIDAPDLFRQNRSPSLSHVISPHSPVQSPSPQSKICVSIIWPVHLFLARRWKKWKTKQTTSAQMITLCGSSTNKPPYDSKWTLLASLIPRGMSRMWKNRAMPIDVPDIQHFRKTRILL